MEWCLQRRATRSSRGCVKNNVTAYNWHVRYGESKYTLPKLKVVVYYDFKKA